MDVALGIEIPKTGKSKPKSGPAPASRGFESQTAWIQILVPTFTGFIFPFSLYSVSSLGLLGIVKFHETVYVNCLALELAYNEPCVFYLLIMLFLKEKVKKIQFSFNHGK